VPFINNFTNFQYSDRLWHCTHQARSWGFAQMLPKLPRLSFPILLVARYTLSVCKQRLSLNLCATFHNGTAAGAYLWNYFTNAL